MAEQETGKEKGRRDRRKEGNRQNITKRDQETEAYMEAVKREILRVSSMSTEVTKEKRR